MIKNITLGSTYAKKAYLGNSLVWSEYLPTELFNGGAVGAIYNPSDLSTLFKDATGAQTVTANNDPVGLRLDKSKGLELTVLNLPTNDISNPISLVANGVFNILQTANTPKGLLKIDIEISGSFSGLALVIDGNGLNFGVVNTEGKHSFIVNNITSTSSIYASLYIKAMTVAQTFKIVSFKVSRVEGHHAVQTVSAARPTYQSAQNKSWLYHDKVDDKMIVKLPTMTATTVVATDDGVTINYPVNITAGDYQLLNNSTLGRDYGRVIINRELTANEKAQITEYFNIKRGV